MTTLNQGRNEIRFNNSDGKCLIENWVEERAVDTIDPQTLNSNTTSSAQLFKDGHKGLLTTEDSGVEKLTTVRDTYKPPKNLGIRLKGARAEKLEKMLYEQVTKEVHEEFNPTPPEVDFNSVTHRDFVKDGFVSKKPAPTAHHDLIREQPVTFWSEHREKLHGVTQVKTGDTPFRKNAAFSTPVEIAYDEPKPFEDENIPKM